MNRYIWPIADKIKIIRDFKPVEPPVFSGNEDAMGFVIWNLYSRVCGAIKSFLALLDNRCYYDAFIIAGHALETCAILSYIKDNSNEAEQREYYNKYLARSSVGRLIANLEMSPTLEKDISWLAYEILLKMLYPVGSSIIKDSKNAKDKHEEVIKKINYRLGSNEEKIKLLKKYYESPRIEEYITKFSDNMGNIDDGQFAMYYTKYCNYKHSNMLTPGARDGDISEEEIDWFILLLLGIVTYLRDAPLTPYIAPVQHKGDAL